MVGDGVVTTGGSVGSGTRNGEYVGLAVGCELGLNEGNSLGNREGVDVG